MLCTTAFNTSNMIRTQTGAAERHAKNIASNVYWSTHTRISISVSSLPKIHEKLKTEITKLLVLVSTRSTLKVVSVHF